MCFCSAITAVSSQLQRDVRKDINDEKKEAEADLAKKREKQEKARLGRGKGKGRGRGRGKKQDQPLEEQEPGKCMDEAAPGIPDKSLQKLRSKREHGSDAEDSDGDEENDDEASWHVIDTCHVRTSFQEDAGDAEGTGQPDHHKVRHLILYIYEKSAWNIWQEDKKDEEKKKPKKARDFYHAM